MSTGRRLRLSNESHQKVECSVHCPHGWEGWDRWGVPNNTKRKKKNHTRIKSCNLFYPKNYLIDPKILHRFDNRIC